MTLRIGCVPYLNAYPLWQNLSRKPLFAPPSTLYQWMEAGTCDVALLPSASLIRHPEWSIISSTCIASEGPVESVKLFHRLPIEACRTILLDPESLTSVLLLKVLLSGRYAVSLNTIDFKSFDSHFTRNPLSNPPTPFSKGGSQIPDVTAADAVLLIGDKALRYRKEGWQELDLGEAWTAWTGLPFVYALWLASPDPALKADCDVLSRELDVSLESTLSTLDQWLPSAARERGFDEVSARRYLQHSLQFRLTASHREGLQAFLGFARELACI